jgi:cyclopropane fatty-acyl-phospholipid synthase-like methyltransferase
MATYSLGPADPEIARLEQQAELLDQATRLLLAESEVAPGMRVLDLGAGLGHVSRAVGDLVGPDGEVVGLDYIASPEELDDTLTTRIESALETAHSVLVPPVLAGAWGCRP